MNMIEPLLVLTKADCPWCDKAKALLDEKCIKYTVISVNGDVGAWKAFLQWQGIKRPTMPTIFMNRKDGKIHRIGGYNVLENILNRQDDEFY